MQNTGSQLTEPSWRQRSEKDICDTHTSKHKGVKTKDVHTQSSYKLEMDFF